MNDESYFRQGLLSIWFRVYLDLGGGGGAEGSNLPPLAPRTPGSRLVFIGFLSLALVVVSFPSISPASGLSELPPPALSYPASLTPPAPYFSVWGVRGSGFQASRLPYLVFPDPAYFFLAFL